MHDCGSTNGSFSVVSGCNTGVTIGATIRCGELGASGIRGCGGQGALEILGNIVGAPIAFTRPLNFLIKFASKCRLQMENRVVL